MSRKELRKTNAFLRLKYRLFHKKIQNNTDSNYLTDAAFFVYIKIYINLTKKI
jgi:hypothetical protein